MKQRVQIIFLIVTITLSLLLSFTILSTYQFENGSSDFFVGIDVAYDDLDTIYALIDEVSPYTNLFVIGSTGISRNETELTQVCQCLSEKNMYFIVYGIGRFRLQSFNNIEESYPNNFLGVYYDDEQGGRQLDLSDHRWVYEAENYTDAAHQFFDASYSWLNSRYVRNETAINVAPSDFHLFTSDYALYWFDYMAGYDAVFAQFGWNYSRQINVALCRGAATIQNKQWGAIITWTYNNPPYIESGEELFNDLVFAYENGAKYILIFDSNEEYTEGILNEEHLDALKQFWEFSKENPRTIIPATERVAYVLPKDFAYGFRGPNDKIWGLWEADDFSLKISTDLGHQLKEYGTNLDIIYDEEKEIDGTYEQYVYWNGTICVP